MKQTKNIIKAARVMQGLTQTQLGKKLGKTQSWVSFVENGGLGEANLVDVLRLCKVLGITITEAAETVPA
jgi:transcriptional regulator with XRE-family HTH domain